MKTTKQSERRERRGTRAAERAWEDEGGSVREEGNLDAGRLEDKVLDSHGKLPAADELGATKSSLAVRSE
ncbi:MAG: hypothetical protein HY329_24670 [Chloroflexi bacterium]|nr:hypothetical protein [Chloroflexota bacterium]